MMTPTQRPTRTLMAESGGLSRHRGDRLRQLRAFCQAARLGSISRAAEEIESSQPAVSVQIRNLEQELGLLLFERHGGRISLTTVGHSLYQLAKPVVECVDRLPETFAERHFGVIGGDLRIGAGQTSATNLLPMFLKVFRERYPEIRIEVRSGTGQERLRWLRDYELDVVVAAMDAPPPDVDFHPIKVSELVLITPEDHPLAGRDSIAIKEATTYPFVGHAASSYISQVATVIARLHGVAPEIVVELDGWSAIKSYVALGVGVAFIPDLYLTERDRLWKIAFEPPIPHRKYGAITRRDGILGEAASRFLRIMAPERSDAPGER